MAVNGGTLQAAQVETSPRWRALAVAAALVGTLWGFGFATGRLTAPAEVTFRRDGAGSAQELIRPGKDRGQVRFGGVSAEETEPIRPGNHGGGSVKGG